LSLPRPAEEEPPHAAAATDTPQPKREPLSSAIGIGHFTREQRSRSSVHGEEAGAASPRRVVLLQLAVGRGGVWAARFCADDMQARAGGRRPGLARTVEGWNSLTFDFSSFEKMQNNFSDVHKICVYNL
jgi:hypothetical protein